MARSSRDETFRASVGGQALAEIAKLREHDPELHRKILVACLDDDEREALAKMSAGVAAGSSPAPPAVKSHQSHHQMRSEDGKFRESRWRRRTPAQPKVGGTFFK